MSRTIMIMAGGTGGHVFPGLAVADFMRDSGWRVIWLGAPSGMEAKLVPSRGYEMAWVNFSGVRRKGFAALAMLPLRLAAAFWQSARAIFAARPDVVLGMGGYISFPGGVMAALLGRPLVIHEQNSVAGLANRVLARIARRALVAFPGAIKGAALAGNPVRPSIAELPDPAIRYDSRSGALSVLVVGGSLGAKALNDTVPQALALLARDERPRVTHQSGRQHLADLRRRYAQAGVEADVLDFIDDMAAAYANADVVICRAGALTISELAAAGVASVLVPYPHAVDDHQTGNARRLADHGAAVLLPQPELTPERLAGLLRELSRERLRGMAQKARALAEPEAVRKVAQVCMEAAR